MAVRKQKPGVRSTRRKPAAPAPAAAVEQEYQPTNEELVVHHLRGIHEALNGIAEQLKVVADAQVERNALLEEQSAPAETVAADAATAPPKRRGRRTNVEIAAAKAAERRSTPPVAEPTPAPAPVVEPAAPPACTHEGTLEALGRPGLARCTARGCNAVMDLPAGTTVVEGRVAAASPPKPQQQPPAAQQTVAVTPAKPTNGAAAIPTPDDVRAVAIVYVNKHGKPKLSAVLGKYGSTSISGVPEESRAAIMAELSAG
jgi:hypothetical protein